MDKFVIFFNETSTNRKYIEYIYRTSVSTDKDIGDAIEFDDKETALLVAKYLNNREGTTKYKVMVIKTTCEIVE